MVLAGHYQPLRVWVLCLYFMGLNLSNWRGSVCLLLREKRLGQRGAGIRGMGALTATPPGVRRRGRSLGVRDSACG